MLINHLAGLMGTARMHDAGNRMLGVNEARMGLANDAHAEMSQSDVASLAQQGFFDNTPCHRLTTAPDLGVLAPCVQHADRLRSLTGKNECERGHRLSLCRRCMSRRAPASEIEQYRAPREAAAHPFEHHRIAGLDLARAHRLVKRQRNRRGRRVAVLVDRVQVQGKHEVDFAAGRLGSGIYFYSLKAGGHTATRRMVIAR